MGPRGLVVTIDGPAGAGKTTVARRLAEQLGYELIPTGAMYRALALSILRADVPFEDAAALTRHLAPIDVRLDQGRVLLEVLSGVLLDELLVVRELEIHGRISSLGNGFGGLAGGARTRAPDLP